MNTEENKALVRRYLKEAWDDGNVDVIDELLSPDFTSLNVPPGAAPDREHEKQLVRSFLDAFGSFQSTIEDQIAEGNTVVTRWTAVGRHQAPFFGVLPTDKLVHMKGTEMAHVRDGQIYEIHANFDMVGLLQALGAIPGGGGEQAATLESPKIAATRPPNPEENKEIMRRLIEDFWNGRRMEVADELVHPQAVSPSAPQLPPGPQGFKDIAAMVFAGFPDFRMSIKEMVAEGDRVAALYFENGTNSGDFLGIPATGKQATWSEFGILRIVDGKIVETWFETDMGTLMAQLGLVPAPAGA
jgi:predicted ester cyclase